MKKSLFVTNITSFAVLAYMVINNGIDVISGIGIVANIISIILIIALEYKIRKGEQ
jgi:hypothetical protein|nr:MAG TPA: hypothetical protein [Caudoviricetes sp.]